MTTLKRPLSHLWSNAKFIHNNKTYTVYQQGIGMAEVFDGKRFWAWPHSTGKELLQVNLVNHV